MKDDEWGDPPEESELRERQRRGTIRFAGFCIITLAAVFTVVHFTEDPDPGFPECPGALSSYAHETSSEDLEDDVEAMREAGWLNLTVAPDLVGTLWLRGTCP